MENNNKFINHGIILKHNSNSTYVLDKRLGKINCSIRLAESKVRLINGAHVSYVLEKSCDYYHISNIRILDAPNNNPNFSYCDLIFFHHILEIGYYFLPLNNNENIGYIFELVLKLYQNTINDNLFKKLFLCDFFKLLGICPEYINNKLLDRGHADIFKLENDILLNNNLKMWLTLCISSQPYYARLKTVSFLKELDIYE